MRKRYQLKTTVPSWIFLAVAVAMFAINWTYITLFTNTNAVFHFRWFHVSIPFFALPALEFIPYLIWIVFLIIGKRLKNPFLTMIVYFSYAILSCAETIVDSVMYTASEGNTAEIWSTVIFNSFYLLLVLLPCFLNAILWRKSDVWAACGAFALLGTAIVIVGYFLSSNGIMRYGRMALVMDIIQMAEPVFMILCWMTYGLMIRRIPGEQTAKQREISASQMPMGPVIPVSQVPQQPAGETIRPPLEANAINGDPQPAAAPAAPPAAQPVPAAPAPVPAAQSGPQLVFCMSCGTQLPGSAKFCSKCGAKIASISD